MTIARMLIPALLGVSIYADANAEQGRLDEVFRAITTKNGQ